MRHHAIALDLEVRRRAFTWLAARVSHDRPWIAWHELLKFKYDDPKHRALANRPQGIWKPADLLGALSLKTRPPERRTDRTFNYDDSLSRDGLVAYKMQATSEQHNNWVRAAHEHELPLIYFLGQRQATYVPIFPVYVVQVDEVRREFLLDLDRRDVLAGDLEYREYPATYEVGYSERLIRQRLHQPAFRSAIMLAYRESCALCSLRHVQLLDAAHIRSDSEGGQPRVSNGIAMCKIHHAAFDRGLLGISPDYEIRIRSDLLQEVDGLMLKYGIQEFHGKGLVVPRRAQDKPNRELLAERFRTFQET